MEKIKISHKTGQLLRSSQSFSNFMHLMLCVRNFWSHTIIIVNTLGRKVYMKVQTKNIIFL